VDLGARSLVGGVDCNGPEKFPLLELLVIFFFASSWRRASSCIYHLACFCQIKNYFE
jgi:hypothetical protein